MLWAIGQPAAALGLAVAFAVALGLRTVVQRGAARLLRLAPYRDTLMPGLGLGVDRAGMLALLLGGAGWGPRVPFGEPLTRPLRRLVAVAAGPVAVVVAGEVALAAFDRGYPAAGAALRINRLSDVLRGVVGLDGAPQLALSTAVGVLGFGLLALVPLPPLDGYAAVRLVLGADTPAGDNAERLGAFVLLALGAVPVGGTPPLLAALDVVGTPLLQLWA